MAFEDKRGNFKLNTGAEKMAFLKDTLSLNDSTPQVELYSFLPKEKDRFYGAKHSSWGKIELPFNLPCT
ncbi:MAG: hypothetical protein U5L96_00150 [Owenweeksia sp.]|nr:hypothetical protein [Owenweeksia sp.]